MPWSPSRAGTGLENAEEVFCFINGMGTGALGRGCPPPKAAPKITNNEQKRITLLFALH
jgi:hypothetical protein